jgi:hypothetical protein
MSMPKLSPDEIKLKFLQFHAYFTLNSIEITEPRIYALLIADILKIYEVPAFQIALQRETDGGTTSFSFIKTLCKFKEISFLESMVDIITSELKIGIFQ